MLRRLFEREAGGDGEEYGDGHRQDADDWAARASDLPCGLASTVIVVTTRQFSGKQSLAVQDRRRNWVRR